MLWLAKLKVVLLSLAVPTPSDGAEVSVALIEPQELVQVVAVLREMVPVVSLNIREWTAVITVEPKVRVRLLAGMLPDLAQFFPVK